MGRAVEDEEEREADRGGDDGMEGWVGDAMVRREGIIIVIMVATGI